MSTLRKGAALLAVSGVALAVTVSAFGGDTAAAQRVTVGMSEFAFVVKPRTVKVGAVVFAVANKGNIAHDFRIAGKKTPVLAAGKAGTLRLTFKKAGRYPFLCTLPSHAAAGMKGVLIVK